MLYRVFPMLAGAGPNDPGGVLFVARERQGAGRHDNPDRYGTLYATRSPESAIAERIQTLRGQELEPRDLVRVDGSVLALGSIDDAELPPPVDLDDPRELLRLDLRPSRVATAERTATQPIALSIFEEGAVGFSWWSTLEASWTNVTLFAERAAPMMRIPDEPEPLSLAHPSVIEAARALGVALAR